MNRKTYLDPHHERRLIALAQAGDVQARNDLIVACLPYIRQTVRCYAFAVDEQDFEDLYHQSVAALYDALAAYDLDHPKRARLYVFAYSRIREAVSEHFKHLVHIEYTDQHPPLEADPPELQLESDQTVAVVRRALDRLTAQEKHVIYSRLALDDAPTRKTLAQDYGSSQQWIAKVEQRAVAKLAVSFAEANPWASQ